MSVPNRLGAPAVAARRGGPGTVMVVHGAEPAGIGPGRAAARDAARRAARGGMLVARTAGRMAQAGAIVSGGTALAAREADGHRRTGHEGGIRRRRGHRALVAVAPGPVNPVRAVATATAHGHAGGAPSFVYPAEAAVACGAPGPGTRVPAGKAHATRETMSWCAGRGARAVIPARTSPSGKSMGSMAWRRHVVANPVPKEMRRRLVRGGDMQSLPPEARAEAQRAWTGENGYGQRPAVECVIGAPRKAFGGRVSARRQTPGSRDRLEGNNPQRGVPMPPASRAVRRQRVPPRRMPRSARRRARPPLPPLPIATAEPRPWPTLGVLAICAKSRA